MNDAHIDAAIEKWAQVLDHLPEPKTDDATGPKAHRLTQ